MKTYIICLIVLIGGFCFAFVLERSALKARDNVDVSSFEELISDEYSSWGDDDAGDNLDSRLSRNSNVLVINSETADDNKLAAKQNKSSLNFLLRAETTK